MSSIKWCSSFYKWTLRAVAYLMVTISFQLFSQPVKIALSDSEAKKLGAPDAKFSFSIDLRKKTKPEDRIVYKKATADLKENAVTVTSKPVKEKHVDDSKNSYRQDVGTDGVVKKAVQKSTYKNAVPYSGKEALYFGSAVKAKSDKAPWAVYGSITDFQGFEDNDGDGYWNAFSFQLALDPDGPGAYACGRAVCTTTGQTWWLYDNGRYFYVNGYDVDYRFWDFNYTDFENITEDTTLDFTVELWDTSQTIQYASNSVVSDEYLLKVDIPSVSWAVYGMVTNFVGMADADDDGFWEMYSFDIALDVDGPGGYVWGRAVCTTTGQSWWLKTNSAAFYGSHGIGIDYRYWSFNQNDFSSITENTTLDFRVEIWDPSRSNRLAVDEDLMNEEQLTVEYLPPAPWTVYSQITDFVGCDKDEDGYYSDFSFDVGLDADGPGGYVIGKLICKTTNESWWLRTDGLWYVMGTDTDYKYWTFNRSDFSIASPVSLDFEAQIWTANRSSLLATEATVTGEPVNAEGQIYDEPIVTVTASNATIGEDGAYGNGTFTFTRTGNASALANTLTVYYTVGGTAIPGSDYISIDTAVTFPYGAATVTKTIVPLQNPSMESDGTIVLTLSTDSNYTVGTPNSATVTMKNLPAISVVAEDDMAGEPETGYGTGTFKFTRTDSSSELVVYYTVSGTATSDTDYTSIGTSVTFAVGESTVIKTVSVIDDLLIEETETVIVTLSAHDDYNIVYANRTATVSIYDDDNDDVKPIVTVSASDSLAGEAGTAYGNGAFTFTRSGSTNSSLPVYFSTSDSVATSGADYTSIGTSVIIPAGESSITVPVAVLQDSLIEGDETVNVTLSSNLNYTIGTPATAIVTIKDRPVVTVTTIDSITGEKAKQYEDTTFRFFRTDSSIALTVYFTESGTALSSSESNTVSFPVDSTSVDFTISPATDNMESITNGKTCIVMINSDSNYYIGAPYSAQATVKAPDNITITPQISGTTTYMAGSIYTVQVAIEHTEASNYPLGFCLTTPAGWSYLSSTASDTMTAPASGAMNNLEWSWSKAPDSPISFTIDLSVPAGQTDSKTISSYATCNGKHYASNMWTVNGEVPTIDITRVASPSSYTESSQVTVTFNITGNNFLTSMYISENIPSGWTVVNLGNGNYSSDNQKIIFQLDSPIPSSVSYVIQAPADPDDSYVLSVDSNNTKYVIGNTNNDLTIEDTTLLRERVLRTTLKLKRGWNLCGVPFMLDDSSIALLKGESDCWVWTNGHFIPLERLHAGEVVWLYVSDRKLLQLTGKEDEPLPLRSGWNLVLPSLYPEVEQKPCFGLEGQSFIRLADPMNYNGAAWVFY